MLPYYLLSPIAFLFQVALSLAQAVPESESPYQFSDSIRQATERDSLDYVAAYAYSFIGDHRRALIYQSKFDQSYGTISRADSIYFTRFRPVDAKEYILRKVGDKQIVMINEAHHVPYHRIFTASLLQGLYDQGFRYFGVETLSDSLMDNDLNERGYPTLNSGFYTKEPQYGNLIRQALAIGYTVFPYEADVTSFHNGKQREIAQARNIQRVVQKHPDANVLIHAGYAHIQEDSVGGDWKKAMAGRVKEFTGIDPFTINQEVLTERSDPAMENPFYRMIDVDRPTVFVDEQGRAFSGPEGTHYYDVRMAHPRTRYVEGRPHWLLYGDRQLVSLSDTTLTVGFPCLMKAYRAIEDPEQAVPVDVVEIADASHKKPLVLAPGYYQVILKGLGQGQKKLNIHVKVK